MNANNKIDSNIDIDWIFKQRYFFFLVLLSNASPTIPHSDINTLHARMGRNLIYKGPDICTAEKESNKLIRHGRDTTKPAAKFNRM